MGTIRVSQRLTVAAARLYTELCVRFPHSDISVHEIIPGDWLGVHIQSEGGRSLTFRIASEETESVMFLHRLEDTLRGVTGIPNTLLGRPVLVRDLGLPPLPEDLFIWRRAFRIERKNDDSGWKAVFPDASE